MVHTYTLKNKKRYRYYVCLNAQQRGWASCPTKSLNAYEIETAVVDYIRGIGRNGEILAATAAKVRQETEKRTAELETERRAYERDLRRLHARLRSIMSEPSAAGSDRSLATDQLADLQDQSRAIEQRMTAIREEAIVLQRKAIDERDLVNALSVFDPVWDSLAPREQSRIIRSLLERISYDGRDGKVTVTFHSPGIKALCMEPSLRSQEIKQ
jgi:site-specific DNA recombinase